MKKFILIVFFFYYIANNSIGSASINQNKIIVKINNDIITSFQLKNKIRTILFLANQETSQENIDITKNQALASLMNFHLKKREIEKYKISANQNSIDSRLLSISSNNIEGLKKGFFQNNLDYELFVDEIKIEMSWQKLIFSLYDKKINEKDLRFQIDNINDLDLLIEEEVKISEIELLADNDNERKNKIDLIINEIAKIGFDNTAVKYSESASAINKGDLGWLNTKVFSEKIFDAIKNLKIGQISDPIIGANNVLFLKLNDKRKTEINNLNKKEIKDKLFIQKKNELFNLFSTSHLSKIRNNALIEYK